MSLAQPAQQQERHACLGPPHRDLPQAALSRRICNTADESMPTAIVVENLSTIAGIEQPPNEVQVCLLT
jgi:hypothetical protein